MSSHNTTFKMHSDASKQLAKPDVYIEVTGKNSRRNIGFSLSPIHIWELQRIHEAPIISYSSPYRIRWMSSEIREDTIYLQNHAVNHTPAHLAEEDIHLHPVYCIPPNFDVGLKDALTIARNIVNQQAKDFIIMPVHPITTSEQQLPIEQEFSFGAVIMQPYREYDNGQDRKIYRIPISGLNGNYQSSHQRRGEKSWRRGQSSSAVTQK